MRHPIAPAIWPGQRLDLCVRLLKVRLQSKRLFITAQIASLERPGSFDHARPRLLCARALSGRLATVSLQSTSSLR